MVCYKCAVFPEMQYWYYLIRNITTHNYFCKTNNLFLLHLVASHQEWLISRYCKTELELKVSFICWDESYSSFPQMNFLPSSLMFISAWRCMNCQYYSIERSNVLHSQKLGNKCIWISFPSDAIVPTHDTKNLNIEIQIQAVLVLALLTHSL